MRKKSMQFPVLLVCLPVVMLTPLVEGLVDSLPVAPLQQNAAPSQEPTDPEEQFKLAERYLKGKGVPQDNAEAVKWFRKAADQGHARAQFNLGLMYTKGLGVPQDYAEAAKWFRKAAEQGTAEAQTNLASMYLNAEGVARDYTEAVKWYRKAAGQGDAVAQFNLGLMYGKGRGIPQDYAEAVRLYRQAAKQGHAIAQFNLGAMYANGRGVPQDDIQAHMWLSLIAATGDEEATIWRDFIAQRMTPEQIGEAQRLARKWSEKHKQQ